MSRWTALSRLAAAVTGSPALFVPGIAAGDAAAAICEALIGAPMRATIRYRSAVGRLAVGCDFLVTENPPAGRLAAIHVRAAAVKRLSVWVRAIDRPAARVSGGPGRAAAAAPGLPVADARSTEGADILPCNRKTALSSFVTIDIIARAPHGHGDFLTVLHNSGVRVGAVRHRRGAAAGPTAAHPTPSACRHLAPLELGCGDFTARNEAVAVPWSREREGSLLRLRPVAITAGRARRRILLPCARRHVAP